ncbi:unnamed protein product [Cylindrotheca closterium]|uniref:Uncharacterized protein n=1 Tax=Cylindrotheca closterium TaxID=2856 RepID=A0AAD2CD49_9STRA|nr:unnamed protein product [Cylindrotheca closterium]
MTLSLKYLSSLLLLIQLELRSVNSWGVVPVQRYPKQTSQIFQAGGNDEDDGEWVDYDDLEVLQGDETEYGDREEDWIPDAARAKKKPKHLTPANEVIKPKEPKKKGEKTNAMMEDSRPTPYTEDEEEIIAAMGGKQRKSKKREDGFLGDCTLAEIALDYSVPICYLADVLCMWGVPVPIDINSRLGDMVTGEQAFALVEAVNSLDIGALQDRYANQDMVKMCHEWEIDIRDAFAFAMKEGWSLPFGVRTVLRQEQEDELLRVYSKLYTE